jgi:hypothetical protein
MSPNQTKPSFVQELGQSRRARLFIFRVGIAVGFDFDDLLNNGPDLHCLDAIRILESQMRAEMIPNPISAEAAAPS